MKNYLLKVRWTGLRIGLNFATFLLVAIMVYGLNYYTPLVADDYSYSFSFSTGERIMSVRQIPDSQAGHYQSMNGRIITHTLAQFFLLLGDDTFNVINTGGFLLLLFLIYFHAFGTFRSFSFGRFFLVFALLFLSCPAFGQSFVWITGAANYLYGILIVLLFLIPYRLQANVTNPNHLPIFKELTAAVFYFPMGLIAGWTNENTSVAMIAMILAYITLFCWKKNGLHFWQISGLLGAILGCFMMLTSPGNAVRMEKLGGSGGLTMWLRNIIFHSCNLVIHLHLLLLLLLLLAGFYIKHKYPAWKNIPKRESCLVLRECGVVLIHLLGLLGAVYSMIVTPSFPDRAWSGPVILGLILVGNLSTLVETFRIDTRMWRINILLFFSLLCVSTYINAFFELKNINAAFQEREHIIQTAISQEAASVEIPNICGWSGYSCYGADGDLNSDSRKWPNTAIARYYGIDEVIALP